MLTSEKYLQKQLPDLDLLSLRCWDEGRREGRKEEGKEKGKEREEAVDSTKCALGTGQSNTKFPAGCTAFSYTGDIKYLLLKKIYHSSMVNQIPFRCYAKELFKYLAYTKIRAPNKQLWLELLLFNMLLN